MISTHEFHPEKISRRGEVILWALTLVSLAVLLILIGTGNDLSAWNLAFVGFMLLSAGSISFGNWMDRQTVLGLGPEGLAFRNGLRTVQLDWDQVQAIQVIPTQWGDQVIVSGAETRFSFRTLSEISRKGEVRNRMGFAQGAFIIEQIVKHGGLVKIDQPEEGRYYARP
jgi:hypothetical protein